MEVSGQLHDPAALSQGKSPPYSFKRRLDGHQSRSGYGGGEKNSQPLPGLEPPVIQPVAQRYTAELSNVALFCREINRYIESENVFVCVCVCVCVCGHNKLDTASC
jgi:hypothetical protein